MNLYTDNLKLKVDLESFIFARTLGKFEGLQSF